MSDIREFLWMFDQRFDSLAKSFKDYLEARDGLPARAVYGHKLFPDLTQNPHDSPPHWAQSNPEERNRSLVDAYRRKDPRLPTAAEVPTACFTNDGLDECEHISVFGVPPVLSHKLNNKAFQYEWLKDGGLPLPPHATLSGIPELEARIDDLLSLHSALFVQPVYSSGGELASVIRKPLDVVVYRGRLEGEAAAVQSPLLVTQFVSNTKSLSGHGIVTRNGDVLFLAVNELLQSGFRFDGFIFPPFASDEVLTQIKDLTLRAGELLAKQGYWGYFTLDVVESVDSVPTVTEVNVRFAGEATFLLSLLTRNVFSLLDGSVRVGQGSLVPAQTSRMLVTKLRPELGRYYRRDRPLGSIEEFMEGRADEFRTCYFPGTIYADRGHFVGLAGRRFNLREEPRTLYSYYRIARQPMSAN